MPGYVEHRIIHGEEFRRVVLALKAQDKTIPRKIRRALRLKSNDAITKVRERVLAIPVKGEESTGLRRRVARGVRLRLNRSLSSARIITMMDDPEEAALPRGLDTPSGWRHPVFGNRDNWVRQTTGGEWFREEIAEQRPEFARAFGEVLDEARDMIDLAGH